MLRSQAGVAMVEATIGTVILMLAALGTAQMVLVFHGALAGHSAVIRAARTMAVTGDTNRATQTLQAQMSTSLRGIGWQGLQCSRDTAVARCEVTITVPSILPGAGLFTGNGPTGAMSFRHVGTYPYGALSGN